jgi:hypothetical protein
MDAREGLFQIVDRHVRRPAVAQIGGFRPDAGLKSWFGGGFFLPPELPWPSSGGKPMIPLLQVVTSELPVLPPSLNDVEVLQVFVGDDLPVDTPAFGGPGFSVLTFQAAPLEPRDPPLDYASPRPFQIRWSLGKEEGPSWEDVSDLVPYELLKDFVKEADCFKAYYDRYAPHPTTKVGGWPSYIQGAPGIDAEFVLQVASEEKPRWMLGDNGTLYFFTNGREWGLHGDCY